jgi:hypothetical protein
MIELENESFDFFIKGDYINAKKHFGELYNQDKNHSYLWYLLSCYDFDYDNLDFQKLSELIDDALKIEKETSSLYSYCLYRKALCVDNVNVEERINLLLKSLQTNPYNFQSLYSLADCYYATNDYENSLYYFKLGLKYLMLYLDENNIKILLVSKYFAWNNFYTSLECEYDINNLDDEGLIIAFNSTKEKIKLQFYPDYLWALSTVSFKLKKYDETLYYLFKIESDFSEFKDQYLYDWIGWTYFRKKEFNSALKYLKFQLEISKNWKQKSSAIIGVAKCMEQLKKPKNEIINIWMQFQKDGILLNKAIKNIKRLENGNELIDENEEEEEVKNIEIELINQNSTKENKRNKSIYKSPNYISSEKLLEENFINAIINNQILNGKYKLFYSIEGKPGRQYTIFEIGARIDILCISKDETELLIIELKNTRGTLDVITQTKRYTEYIKKNIAKENQKVKGLIIISDENHELKSEVAKHPNLELMKYDFKLELNNF